MAYALRVGRENKLTLLSARWSIPLVVFIVAVIVGALAISENSAASQATGPFAYVALGSGSVGVIDLSTETEIADITTGGRPYWIAISANGATVAASLHNSTGVALINGTTNTLIGVVSGVGSEPEAVAVNSAGTTVYVADESGNDLYEVDVGTETVTAGPIDLPTCDEPENMVISPDDAYLYITCAGGSGSEVLRVATTGFDITTVSGGLSDPHGIALNSAGTRLYYTDGTDVFEWDTGTQSLTGTTFSDCQMYFGAVSFDGSLLLCQEEFGPLRVYNTSDGTLVNSVDVGGTAVGIRGDGARAYVPNGSVVEVVDMATISDLPGSIAMTGSRGRGIAIGPTAPTPTPTPSPSASPEPEQTAAPAAALPNTGGQPASVDSVAWLGLLAAAVAAAAVVGGALTFGRIRR